jgi:hypothetical protein
VERVNGRLQHLQKISQQLVNARLATFVVGAGGGAAALAFAGAWQWALVSVVFVAAFIALLVIHRRVEEGMRRYEIWQQTKASHLARMDLRWADLPAAMPIPPQFEHPFALDLDLIGERSLHRLLDTAVAHEASIKLRDWLLDTHLDAAAIQQRRELVQELRDMPLFRDKLRLNALLVDDGRWQGRPLLDWLNRHIDASSLRPILLFLGVNVLVNYALALLYFNGTLSIWWPFASWSVFALVSISQWSKTGPLFQDASFLAESLRRLGRVFGFLEEYRYGKHERVQGFCALLGDEAERPSQHLKRINRVVSGAGLRYNPGLNFILNFLLPWDIYFAYRLEQCQRNLSTRLPRWLNVWYELEALSSLATYTYLHPDTIFPTISDDAQPHFRAHQLGHPLIPHTIRVCNDYCVDEVGSLAIITGSNMAGKSSFLRTIGINLRLAYAGGSVVAQSLETILFRLYTSIQIQDSLSDGFSFFYAEVRRLKALLVAVEDSGERPLFFLIDEIFRGTNNRERLIGSRAYVRALSGKNGVGLIATHDLELVKLAQELPGIRNFHFRDDVVDGRMTFDYLLHPGPCPTTNALKIMQLTGLPIEETHEGSS